MRGDTLLWFWLSFPWWLVTLDIFCTPVCTKRYISFFKVYFINCTTIVPTFFYILSPFILHLPTLLPFLPSLSSRPLVVHINTLAAPFPILFLTSPCLFCAYHLCFLFPVCFSHPVFSLPLPTGKPPFDLHFCEPVPVLVVCLVFRFFRFSCR